MGVLHKNNLKDMGLAGIEQTDLVQYMDKWRAVVERVEWMGVLHKNNLNDMGLASINQTDLVQYTDKWWAVVERVVNLQVPENLGNCFLLKKDPAPWND